ncbi:hypothetical protein NIES2119_06215 [[Phormidium ambiguum] IAM M-71]|uniref:Uncharacterized protein n=1 Tax=[Phormidium ambiguum] IAM M-71 TaxID=454136 RepID=A0A1U7IPU0_9CYAN|nr:hypothetical protein [Phormidium ambiguum]OKH39332.1 hypothetical protein NIES2119_06215 [Phormidium ambiguum IAM M-71]
MEDQPKKDQLLISLSDEKKVTQALAKAVREALRKHKQTGNSVAVWRDGKVVWIPPEEINLIEQPLID